MSTVIKSVDVDVPVSTAFQEWTRFEELPRFMHGVVEVRRLNEQRLFWRAQVAGVVTTWELEITELVPEEKIAWCSCVGPKNQGTIHFEPLPTGGTHVRMVVRYDPTSFMQYVTDYLGVLTRWVERDLAQFKALVEEPYSTLGRLPSAEELIGQ